MNELVIDRELSFNSDKSSNNMSSNSAEIFCIEEDNDDINLSHTEQINGSSYSTNYWNSPILKANSGGSAKQYSTIEELCKFDNTFLNDEQSDVVEISLDVNNHKRQNDDKVPFWPPSPFQPAIPKVESHRSFFVDMDIGVEMISVIRGDFQGSSSKMLIQQDLNAIKLEDWDYPGWGNVIERTVDEPSLPNLIPKHKLTSLQATAIAGNDLLASVLYTTGIVCGISGKLAPFAMLLCCLALYPFKKIFQECGTALPLNGGVYVALLNSSSKFTATFAATCSLISYASTAVVSAASCTSYAAGEFGEFPMLGVTIGILAVVAILVIFGVKDSSNVALAIFLFHITTLAILCIAAFIQICQSHGDMYLRNWRYPLPTSYGDGSIGIDIYLGFSAALLGLTGFETSANYIEEAGPFETEKNKTGLVRKISAFENSIKNMWLLVMVINPTVTTLSLGVVDLADIIGSKNNFLSIVGERAAGIWLRRLVSIDALVVLSGGVLTAYLGVTGLIKQLAADRCLPAFLLHSNTAFGTYHWIIVSFLILTVTLYSMTNGDVTMLSGVFAIAFLMVMISFAFANMKLKFCRPRLPRGVRASWPEVTLGLVVMLLGLIGNFILNPTVLLYFFAFLLFFLSVIVITFSRMKILKFILYFIQQVPSLETRFGPLICETLIKMKKLTVVFFANTSELHILNKALLYARDNELCDRIIIAHIYNPIQAINSEIRSRLKENLHILDHIYPKMKVDLLLVAADEFNPKLVKYLSKELNIQPSFMFIRCPGADFPYNIGEFDGVRTIMR